MEVSDVRRQVLDTIERAKRAAAERRARADEATREYDDFLAKVATPVFRQVANVLKAEGYPFSVFTPGGGVRIMSDRHGENFVELVLDTTGERPVVTGHSSRSRGSRIIEREDPISDGPIREIDEERVLRFLLKELSPFVER